MGIARSAWSRIKMPKEIVHVTIDRPNTNVPWGFVIIGGKDQSLTVKIGKVKPYSPAENAGLKSMDYLHTINGKEVFEMTQDNRFPAFFSSILLFMAVNPGNVAPSSNLFPSGCYTNAIQEQIAASHEFDGVRKEKERLTAAKKKK